LRGDLRPVGQRGVVEDDEAGDVDRGFNLISSSGRFITYIYSLLI
jgi:hypothetical protein